MKILLAKHKGVNIKSSVIYSLLGITKHFSRTSAVMASNKPPKSKANNGHMSLRFREDDDAWNLSPQKS